MNFYTKKRTRPAVPIITLIDILAILLIFFIVTTTFKKKESLVKVNLPKSSEMSPTSENSPVRIALTITPKGEVALGDQLISMEQIEPRLRALKRSQPNAKLELRADEDTPLKWMVKVWDGVSSAGVEVEDIPLRILLEK